MKKITILLLIMCICLSFGLLISCGGGGGNDLAEDNEENDVNNYLCFTSTGKSTITINGDVTPLPKLKYSKDKTTWEDFDIGDTKVNLENGEKVYFRGDNTSFSKDDVDYLNFAMTGSIAASGNIMSLLDKTCKSVIIPNNYCFYGLFDECDVLTAAPELPATTLAEGCYDGMFNKCTNLTVAPELPAITLTPSCYASMFSNCEKLTAAPELPAETLVEDCYFGMFLNCHNLNSITVHFTDWNFSDNSTVMWVYGVADDGEFRCPSALVATVPVDGYWGDDKVPTNNPSYKWEIKEF